MYLYADGNSALGNAKEGNLDASFVGHEMYLPRAHGITLKLK